MRLITVLGVLSVATAMAAGSSAGATIPVRGTAGAGATVPVRPDDRAGVKGPGAIVSASDASVRPDDRAGVRGPGAIAGGVAVASVRPDDRAGTRGPGGIAATNDAGPIAGVSMATVRPDDRAGLRGPGAFTVPATTPNVEIVRMSSDGFDWPAALVGAVSTLGLCLLVGAALLLRPRGRTTATS